MEERWHVYMVRCADGALYTGISRDVQRRVAEHNGGSRGAKSLRGRRPVVLVYEETCGDRAMALRREARIKRLSRAEKEALLSGAVP